VQFKFVNTSAVQVEGVLDRSTHTTTYTDPQHFELAPGGQTGPPASIEGTERATLQVAAGDKLATITLTGWADGAACHVQGMALVH
jgi:hypothetical protein